MDTEETVVPKSIENAYGLIRQLKTEIDKKYESQEEKEKVNNILNQVSEIMEEMTSEDSTNEKIDSNIDTIDNTQIEETKEKSEDTKDENLSLQVEKRTLIISEKEGKVILPYSKANIYVLIQDGIYETEEEAIEKKYTISLAKYKNEALSRVVEGYKLARKKEGRSITESLKYALNLIFERRLHPAIITACNSIDELDIYLACLEESVTELFDFFEVIFEYSPMKTKQKNEFF